MVFEASRKYAVLFLFLAMLPAMACRSTAPFVWMDEWSGRFAEIGPVDSTIGIGDTLSVRVWNQEAVSSRVKVRVDGKIALPLVGDVDAGGKRPEELAKQIETLLAKFMVTPSVTVNVDEVHTTTVSVIGEVTRPGSFNIRPRTGILEAIANAGGFTEFASDDRIFILRRGDRPVRLRCTYQSLTSGTGPAASFVLLDGDVLVIE